MLLCCIYEKISLDKMPFVLGLEGHLDQKYYNMLLFIWESITVSKSYAFCKILFPSWRIVVLKKKFPVGKGHI